MKTVGELFCCRLMVARRPLFRDLLQVEEAADVICCRLKSAPFMPGESDLARANGQSASLQSAAKMQYSVFIELIYIWYESFISEARLRSQRCRLARQACAEARAVSPVRCRRANSTASRCGYEAGFDLRDSADSISMGVAGRSRTK
jgi:hypothetical protein